MKKNFSLQNDCMRTLSLVLFLIISTAFTLRAQNGARVVKKIEATRTTQKIVIDGNEYLVAIPFP